MTDKPAFRPTLAVDFDGVVNPYSRGWQGGELYEREVTPGFWLWLETVSERFDVVIHSSRFADRDPQLVGDWLRARWAEHSGMDGVPDWLERLAFSPTKPPAWLTVDDRCVRFDGDWSADELRPEAMLAFEPWTQRNKP